MDRQLKKLNGGKGKELGEATKKRNEKMKAQFDKIDENRKKTDELRKKKEKMLKEQAEFVPPPMPAGFSAKPKPTVDDLLRRQEEKEARRAMRGKDAHMKAMKEKEKACEKRCCEEDKDKTHEKRKDGMVKHRHEEKKEKPRGKPMTPEEIEDERKELDKERRRLRREFEKEGYEKDRAENRMRDEAARYKINQLFGGDGPPQPSQKRPVDPAKVEDAKARIEARVFKIKQEREAKNRTLEDDLKLAVKEAEHKRNRSPDDGFVLVGDRRTNVSKKTQPVEESDESSDGDGLNDQSVGDMISQAKKNADKLFDQQQDRLKLEKEREEKKKKIDAMQAEDMEK